MPRVSDVTIASDDAATLLIAAFRYSLGRRSYMPSLVQDIIKKYHSGILSSQMLRQFARDIDMTPNIPLEAEWQDFSVWCLKTAEQLDE